MSSMVPVISCNQLNEMFLVLYRLRGNVLEKYLGDRYSIDSSIISRIFTTWINFLFFTPKQLLIWASHEVVNQAMSACFKASYLVTRIIIDCTKLFIEIPSSFRAQSQMYSSYQSHNTAKDFVGIAPSGIVTLISWGHISDKKITQECGLIHLLASGDVVMVDKGFDIQHLLASKCVNLNIPHTTFLKKRARAVVTWKGSRNKKCCIRSYSCGESNWTGKKLLYLTRCYSNIFTCTVWMKFGLFVACLQPFSCIISSVIYFYILYNIFIIYWT